MFTEQEPFGLCIWRSESAHEDRERAVVQEDDRLLCHWFYFAGIGDHLYAYNKRGIRREKIYEIHINCFSGIADAVSCGM